MDSARRWFVRMVCACAVMFGLTVAAHAAPPAIEAFPDEVIHVKPSSLAWSSQSGVNWGSAYRRLRDAIDAAQAYLLVEGQEEHIVHIWVFEGTYKPDESDNPAYYIEVDEGVFELEFDNDDEQTFMLHRQVQILGGFFSTSADSSDERDPERHVSMLSGDLTGDDLDALFENGTYSTFDENSRHVVTADPAADASSFLDGVSVRGGFADGSASSDNDKGGGLIIGGGGGIGGGGSSSVPPSISNVLFTYNYAQGMGGALFTTKGDPFQLWDCRFVLNRSGNGQYNKAGALLSDTEQTWLVRCTFDRNYTTGDGGAVSHNEPPFPAYKLISCTFTNNVADESGGAVFLKTLAGSGATDGGTEITNCLFAGNEAAEGGAIFGGTLSSTFGSNPLLISNCTFVDNISAGDYGGLILNLPSSSNHVHVRNSIFWNNTGNGSGIQSQIAITPNQSQLTVQYSDVDGWCALSSITCSSGVDSASGNKDMPPQFRSAGYRPDIGSPCIDAGSNTLLAGTPDTADLDGLSGTTSLPLDIVSENRNMDGDGVGSAFVDMGAYEVPDAVEEPCPGDLNDDCAVTGVDLALLLGEWTGAAAYPSCPPYAAEDLNADCRINGFDLALLLAGWGDCGCESLLFGSGEEEESEEDVYPTIWWWFITGDYASIAEWAASQ